MMVVVDQLSEVVWCQSFGCPPSQLGNQRTLSLATKDNAARSQSFLSSDLSSFARSHFDILSSNSQLDLSYSTSCTHFATFAQAH